MFKNIRFVMLLNPSFKMTANFANIARTIASKSKLYTRKYFKSLEIGSLFGK